MRRMILGALLGAAALVAAPFAGSAPAQGAGDLAAFCQTRAGIEAAFGSEDDQQITAALDSLKTNAPPEVAADATVIAAQLAKSVNKAFENKKFLAALERVDTFVLANCGFPEIDVVGIDYEFQAIPATIPAGTTAFKFTNEAPKEDHEMVIFRLKPGETIAAKQLLKLPEKKAEKLVDFVTASEAAPGHFQVGITDLTPGHYIVACFHPVGGTKNGKPHWVKGMLAEFDVPAA